MVLLNILILVVGFAALIKGADLFVDGSASLARIFRVPAMIVGLTIVAMGTSAPELAVSTVAAIEGSTLSIPAAPCATWITAWTVSRWTAGSWAAAPGLSSGVKRCRVWNMTCPKPGVSVRFSWI